METEELKPKNYLLVKTVTPILSSPKVKNASSGNPLFFQPRLTVNEPGDIYEQEADEMADKVMRMPDPSKKPFFTPPLYRKCEACEEEEKNKVQMKAATPVIQKQDGDKKTDEKKPGEEKPEVKTGFIDTESLKAAMKEIFGKLPERYQAAYNNYSKTHQLFIFDLSESRKLASNEIMALWNLSNALVYKSYTGYKDVGFGDSIKIAESLSGVSDTYINLASIVLQKDLNKYISDEVPDLIKKNLGFVILAGLLAQGGIAAVQYATSSEADFTSLLNPVLSSYTTPPVGLTNPLQLDNIADPRWKSPFSKPSPGLDINYTEQTKDPKVAPALNVNVGFNVASALSLYPKNEEEKKKYKGFEAYPFFNFTKSYAQASGTGTEEQDKYFAGIFIGDKGVYTLLEGGVIKGPLGVMEAYGKGGLVLKNLGNLKLFSIDVEGDRNILTGTTRARINSAAQIEVVDNEKWQFILGGTVGGLIPAATTPGSLDYGAMASLYYKDYSADKKDVYKTGGELGFSTRSQDPFDETSKQLFTLKAGLVFKGVVRLGLQYDQISGTGPVNTFTTIPSGIKLPSDNLTFYGGFDFAPLLFRDEKKK
jgi:hypothetical protein